jgi:hypothetical protein
MSFDPDKKITETEKNIERLKTDLSQAEDMAHRYQEKAMQLNTRGDDKAGVERALLTKRSAQDSADTNRASIASEQERLAAMIAERDARLDKKARYETADEIAKKLDMSRDIERDGQAFFARLEAFTAWARPFVPEAQGLMNYSQVSSQQIPEALALVRKLAGVHAQAVMAGTAPATLKRADVPIVQPVTIAPTRTTLFCMRPIKYIDPDSGELVAIQQFQDGKFPPEYAKAALDLKVACRVSDPQRQGRHNTLAGHANLGQAFDLDAAMAEKRTGPKLVEPIRQSNPQFVETIGIAKFGSISR